MLQDFVIIHRRKPLTFAEHDVPVWATCLRSLAFATGAPRIEILPSDEIHRGHHAYQFLLEIACGLHSPIVGETEVFGQFKTFAPQWVKREPNRGPLVQRLLNDCKSLRAQHLSHLGTQSYGSWLRRNLRCERVHVLGAGQLVREILPYLAKQADVVLHAREPAKIDFHPLVQGLHERGFDRGALVVAAPLPARDISYWLNGRRPHEIFDLRDNSSIDRLSPESVPLARIFADIEQNKNRLHPVIERIREEISARAGQLAAAERLRPQGWDDLCA